MRRVLFALVVTAVLTACSGALEQSDDQFVAETFNQASAGDFDAIERRLTPTLRTPQSRSGMSQIQTIIQAAGEPCERKFVWATTLRLVSTGGSGRRASMRHTYHCPNQTLLVEATIWTGNGEPSLIENFHVTQIDADAAAEAADFSLSGKSPAQYAFLAMAIASPLLMLIALLGVIFTRGFKRKWLWGIISLVGVVKLSMIWPTGAIHTDPLTINIIGFGVMRGLGPLDPWVVSFTPPIGALIVLSLLWPRWAGLSGPEKSNS